MKSSMSYEAANDRVYDVEYEVSGQDTKDTFEAQGSSIEVDILGITFEGTRIHVDDWDAHGLDTWEIIDYIVESLRRGHSI